MEQIENFLAPKAAEEPLHLKISEENGTRGNIYRGTEMVSSTFKDPEQIQITGMTDFEQHSLYHLLRGRYGQTLL